MEQEQFLDNIAAVNRRAYHIRLWPFFPCDVLLLFSILLFLPAIFRWLLLLMPENNIKQQFLAFNLPYMAFLIVGSTFLLIFLILVIYSHLARPESNFRIREEIKRFFWDKVLICKSKAEMRQYLFIYPKIETLKDVKAKIVHFTCNSPRFNEQSLEQLKNIANFRNVQSVEIEPWIKKNGRQKGYKLTLFYESEDNIFNNQLERL